MSKGDTFENNLLNLIFKGTAIANIVGLSVAVAAGTSTSQATASAERYIPPIPIPKRRIHAQNSGHRRSARFGGIRRVRR